jgi:hypothetical protein
MRTRTAQACGLLGARQIKRRLSAAGPAGVPRLTAALCGARSRGGLPARLLLGARR